jgi:ribonuclease T1
MSPQQRRTLRTLGLVLACVLVLGLWWWAERGSSGSGTDAPGGQTRATAVAPSNGGGTPRQPTGGGDTSGLPTVSVSDLPPEARKTVDLIKAGGPFPYDRDGVVFQNRERILPGKQRGYYREYTVPTPGENDRGARRIITGQQGELYWTADHYDSFSVIVEDP